MSEQTPLPDRITCRADVDALLAAATNYEERFPRDPLRKALDLDRVRTLLASVGNPQEGPRTVHVAGSKGKGTVARMIAAGLRAAGRGPVGLYTSPHLEDLVERIEIDGEPVAEGALARAADAVLPHVRETRGTPDAPTFFEIFTAIAWLVFREAGCTDVVLETGLGGRLDATNVCHPAVTVITMIELEHTRWLGETLREIAAEKAGIIKQGIPVVTYAQGPARRVIEAAAARANATCLHARSAGRPRAPTDPQARTTPHAENVRAAFTALALLDAETPWQDLSATPLPGILETVATRPKVIIDGAHTVASAKATSAATAHVRGTRVTLLFAMLEEKDTAGVARALTRDVTHVVTTRVASPRAIPENELADTVRSVWEGEVEAIADLPAALARARELAGEDGLVLCTGSVYLAGAVKTLLKDPALRDSRGS